MIWGDTYTYAKDDLEHYCKSKVNAEQKYFIAKITLCTDIVCTAWKLQVGGQHVYDQRSIKILIDWARRNCWMKYDHVCTKAIQQIAQRTAGVTYIMYKIDILNHRI